VPRPAGRTSLKVAVGEAFTTRCATCGRSLPLDEVVWTAAGGPDEKPLEPDDSVRRAPRSSRRRGPATSVARARPPGRSPQVLCLPGVPWATRRRAAQRRARCRRPGAFPGDPRRLRPPSGPGSRTGSRSSTAPRTWSTGWLDLHTPRSARRLEAILDRIEGDLRAAPVEAALRLGFLHALLPASRLNGLSRQGRDAPDQAGRVRPPSAGQWREAPSIGSPSRMGSGPSAASSSGSRAGPVARSRRGSATTSAPSTRAAPRPSSGSTGPSTTRAIGEEASLGRGWDGASGGIGLRRRIRLVLGQPPVRPSQERLSLTDWANRLDARGRGRRRAATGGIVRPPDPGPWGWQAASLARSPASVEPSIARDGEVIQLVEGGPEALVAAAMGGVGAGIPAPVGPARRRRRRGVSASVELVPPGAVLPTGPRTRANVALDPRPGGSGDPDVVPGTGCSVPPSGSIAGPSPPPTSAHGGRGRGREPQGTGVSPPRRIGCSARSSSAGPGGPAPASRRRPRPDDAGRDSGGRGSTARGPSWVATNTTIGRRRADHVRGGCRLAAGRCPLTRVPLEPDSRGGSVERPRRRGRHRRASRRRSSPRAGGPTDRPTVATRRLGRSADCPAPIRSRPLLTLICEGLSETDGSA